MMPSLSEGAVSFWIALLSWPAGLYLLWRVRYLPKPQNSPEIVSLSLSIVVPARNEEKNISNLMESLQNLNPQPVEILVVDDGSEDNTSRIAKESGVKVLSIQDKPAGWNGKSYACWLGANEAVGDWLLFLDADVRLERTSLASLMAAALKNSEPTMVSVQPWHSIEYSWENICAFVNVMILAGLNAFTPKSVSISNEVAGAYGPCILVPRREYFEMGGHKVLRGEKLEDIPFGRRFASDTSPKRRVELYAGGQSVWFHMYPEGIKSMLEGFSKSFALGAKASPPNVVIATVLWISGAFSAFSFLILAAIPPFSNAYILELLAFSVYFVHCAVMLRAFRIAGHFSRFSALVYPVALIFFCLVHLKSILSIYVFKKTKWRGRYIEEN